MSEMKYIVVKDDLLGELIFTFPKIINHNRFFESVRITKFGSNTSWKRELADCKVISAGFVMNGTCYGRSESLNLESRGVLDSKLL